MKHNLNVPIFLFLFLFSGNLSAQLNKEEQIIVRAMKDQLQYSMDSLKLNNFPRPWFIRYTYKNGKFNNMRYSRGALFEEDLAKPISLIRADIIVEDNDGVTNLNLNQKGFPLLARMGEGVDAVPIRPTTMKSEGLSGGLAMCNIKKPLTIMRRKKTKQTNLRCLKQ